MHIMTVAHAISVGDRAADFVVPAVDGGSLALADFTGRQAVFLGLYRGLHCPFCRRHLAQLDLIRAKLEPLAVATVAIVNTPLDRARLYFRFRGGRSGVRIGADPDLAVHRAYAVPKIEFVEAAARTEPWPVQTTIEEFLSHRINPTGELEAPVNPLESNDVLNARDGFRLTEADEQVRARHGTQLVGMFLIDREGIVRWRFVEGEASPADIGRLPTPQQIVDAAAALPR
jgi:peroxiredoxin